MDFIKIDKQEKKSIDALSKLASKIVKEHFDPIIGSRQNDYMISKFQTAEAISKQLEEGYQYYFCVIDGDTVGFLGFYKRNDDMYLSKFYLKKEFRGKGLSKTMLEFVVQKTREQNSEAILLNVNKNNSAVKAYERMGFCTVREEVNDIGRGYVMDDYVMRYEVGRHKQAERFAKGEK